MSRQVASLRRSDLPAGRTDLTTLRHLELSGIEEGEQVSNTRNQLKQVFDALRELMTPPDPPKRPIGFVHPEDGKKGGKGKA